MDIYKNQIRAAKSSVFLKFFQIDFLIM